MGRRNRESVGCVRSRWFVRNELLFLHQRATMPAMSVFSLSISQSLNLSISQSLYLSRSLARLLSLSSSLTHPVSLSLSLSLSLCECVRVSFRACLCVGVFVSLCVLLYIVCVCVCVFCVVFLPRTPGNLNADFSLSWSSLLNKPTTTYDIPFKISFDP